MSLETRLERQRVRLHRRKARRDRQRRLWARTRRRGHARAASREARAVRTIRAEVRATVDLMRRTPRVMFDDTSVGLIPRRARAVAGYVDGSWPTFAALGRLFPRAERVSIAVAADSVADCLDVEPGDATNADAPGWHARYRRAHPHTRPIFYTSASNADALAAELARAGVARREYVLWTAHYGAGRHVCGPETCGACARRADGTQWTSSSHGRSLDESWLRRSFWDRRRARS